MNVNELSVIEIVGLVAAVVMPLWNIPLIARIIQRRSSDDISLLWALGVWACILLMAPSGFMAESLVWKAFNIMNLIMFTAVVFFVVKYHKGKNGGK
jgi:hypothetical protein